MEQVTAAVPASSLLPLLPATTATGKRATGDLYAVKVMRKVDLIRKNMVQSVKNERNILAMANNPFVVSRAWEEAALLGGSVPLSGGRKHSGDIFYPSFRAQVRFYYSFTSRDNLYIVMEYLNGGDCFSLLRNLGALDEVGGGGTGGCSGRFHAPWRLRRCWAP